MKAQAKQIDLEEIKKLELLMLPRPGGRDRNESPKAALDRAQQLIYADFLESKGELKGAAFFRKDDEIEVNKIAQAKAAALAKKKIKKGK
jgi:hypothetical protein